MFKNKCMHKILLVDNDNDICLSMSKFLTKNNYAFSHTDNGGSTIEWMKKNKPHLVLCKCMLGDMTGIELLGKIKETHPEAVIFMVTDQSNVKEAVDALRAGAHDYIVRPISPDE